MLRNTSSCLVKLSQPSEIALNVQLSSANKSTRQKQKLKTLTKYVQQHPSGWKKRLELADVLYETGSWTEAIAEYYQVLERQPQLIDIRLKLGKILQLIAKKTEAIEVYQQTLTLCSNTATNHHIRGLIAICKTQYQQAIQNFKLAIAAEPENPAHWLVLGQVHLELENTIGALEAFEQILVLEPEDLIALIYIHDALIALSKFAEAEAILNLAEETAPNDYTVLTRRLATRLRLKLVFGKEGKQTKKMVTTLLKLAPHSVNAHQLKDHYYFLREESTKA